MKSLAIQKESAPQKKETGGPFSHFQISAGAVLIKAFSEIMTAMKRAESLYNSMMNESIDLQRIASNANAKAAKRSLELDADQMKTQAWTTIASGAAAFANTAADLFFSWRSASAANGIKEERAPLENDIKNAEAYRTELGKARVAALSQKKTPKDEAQETEILKISTEADTKSKTSVEKDQTTIALMDDPQAKEGVEAYNEVIKNRRQKLAELQDKLAEARNQFQQIQTIFGSMRGWTNDIPSSIANFLNEAKKRLQGAEEKLKILASSTEQMNHSMESNMQQSYNAAVQRLNEVAQQFKELVAGDAYRG